MADDSTTVPSHREIKQEAVDSISSLPDAILQHLLSFTPTKFAIRTSLLSRRWRHVWCDTPCLSFESGILMAASINETLDHYTAPKLMSFHLFVCVKRYALHVGRWIEFAMSRNVENLSLGFWLHELNIPDFFYTNSSVKQLTLNSYFADIVPTCYVSWTSLKKLYLHSCWISDESMANILSGCPILESLKMYFCGKLTVLDLSKSLRLIALQVEHNVRVLQIVAPHIHCLRLRNFQLSSTLVDVSSSLTEATLEIGYGISELKELINTGILQVMVLKMLEKLQSVEKLTLGGLFLQILSLAELLGVPFPMLKVKTLTLETEIFRYVIPGIERLLRNSPDLKKLTLHTTYCYSTSGPYFDDYLASQGLNPDQCWRSRGGVLEQELLGGRAKARGVTHETCA